jgi:dienelactone hydrolase
MAGKLLARGRLDTTRASARPVHGQRPLSESATRPRLRTRRGVAWGIAAAATVGLVAASTVIPRGGSLLPVALVMVGAGWAAIGLVHGAVVLAARIVGRRPPRIAALAVAALLLVGVVPASVSSTAWLLAAAFVLGGALCGAGVAQLSGPRAEDGQRLGSGLAWATGAVAVVAVGAWVAAGGAGPEAEPVRPTGQLAFVVGHYGSGDHPHRAEFAEPDVVTATVDGGPFLESWVGVHGWLRSRHFEFGPDRLPLNATVWLPEVDDPAPLVLVAHGNHSMYVPSDRGHAWLAEELASHGYAVVSVDQTFLNDGVLGFTDEYDARAWLLLEHLRLWRGWQRDPANFFFGRVDPGRVALVGHSRGGEAVAHAALLDTLGRWPDDASVRFEGGFGIEAVVALAPMDGAYRPAGRATRLQDVSYLTVHPGRDGDHPSFHGLRQYERTTLGGSGDALKAAVYLEDANHAQFNTAWRNSDLPGLAGRMLDTANVMPFQDQQRDVATAVLAFLDATLHDDRARLEVLHDPSHPVWSGATRVLTRYATSDDVVLADFAEDADPGTGTLPGTLLSGSGLTVWREEPTPVRGGVLDASSVVLGWDTTGPASYSITVPAELSLPADPVLLLDVAETAPGTGADFTVRTRDAAGTLRTTTAAVHGGVPPAPQPRRLRPPLREPLPSVEPLGQTLRVPIDHDHPLTEIHLIFDRAPEGSIRIDRIAIGSNASGGPP